MIEGYKSHRARMFISKVTLITAEIRGTNKLYKFHIANVKYIQPHASQNRLFKMVRCVCSFLMKQRPSCRSIWWAIITNIYNDYDLCMKPSGSQRRGPLTVSTQKQSGYCTSSIFDRRIQKKYGSVDKSWKDTKLLPPHTRKNKPPQTKGILFVSEWAILFRKPITHVDLDLIPIYHNCGNPTVPLLPGNNRVHKARRYEEIIECGRKMSETNVRQYTDLVNEKTRL